MEPLWQSFSFRTEAGMRILQVEGLGLYDVRDAAFEARFEDGVYELSVVAAAPLRLIECEVGFRHDFDRHDRVLLNGYQSWTSTEWKKPDGMMRGLERVPGSVVKRYNLDALGDYRFVEYSGKPGHLHGFSYAAVRSDGDFALIGGLQEKEGFTLIRMDCDAHLIRLEPECPERVLRAGERTVVCRVAVLSGEEEQVYDRWFELAGIRCRTAKRLCGYSSWYRRYEDIDEGKAFDDLAGVSAAFEDLDTEGLECVFQLDDGWCRKGDWLAPDEQRFPHGMKIIADAAREQGFLPGLWMAPFVAEEDSAVVAEHPDWLLRDAEGQLVASGGHWSGHYALDTMNEEVRSYVAACVDAAVREWGFGLLKLDFLYAACLEPHAGLNRGQLMADAWGLLREAAGEDALLLACGVPLASVFGTADYCRIGCDVGLDWDDKLPMRLLHRERVSTKKSLRDTLARAPLDGRVFGNDPDVVFLREDTKLSRDKREKLLAAAAEHGSVLFTSDDMGEWNAAQRAVFAGALAQLRTRD